MLSQATSIASPKVALFGVTYRGNVDDARETPALPIALRLLEAPVDEKRLFLLARAPSQELRMTRRRDF